MVFDGFRWVFPMVFDGFQWISMGFRWFSMDSPSETSCDPFTAWFQSELEDLGPEMAIVIAKQ